MNTRTQSILANGICETYGAITVHVAAHVLSPIAMFAAAKVLGVATTTATEFAVSAFFASGPALVAGRMVMKPAARYLAASHLSKVEAAYNMRLAQLASYAAVFLPATPCIRTALTTVTSSLS